MNIKRNFIFAHTGFSISFGVDGLKRIVGGGRNECRRHEPLGGSGGMLPQKNFKI